MPNIGSTLSIAHSGLRANQKAMDVTAHNLANASTDGYARQRAVLSSNPAVVYPDGTFGTGVSVADVQRVADPLLDAAYRRDVSASTREEARAGVLVRLEGVLAEPSEAGLSARLDAFFNSFSELAANPNAVPERGVLVQRAAQLADRLNGMAADIDVIRQDVDARLEAATDAINGMARDIADLNRRIVSAEAGGTTSGDLRDVRARMLDELGRLLPARVSERSNGSVGVSVGGISIIDGAGFETVEVRSAGGVASLGVTGRATTFSESGGTVGGLLTALNSDISDTRAELDAIADALVTEVNALHTTGTNPDGNTGVDFFDAAGLTASSIALSGAVAASHTAVAAGTADGSGGYRAGANDVALGVAGLRNQALAGLGETAHGAYSRVSSTLGQSVRSARDAAASHEALAEHSAARRMSLSGVSVDEELVKMIQFQGAYQASARVITAVDEMLQSLLAI